MQPAFVTEVPTVEIIDGLVHTRLGDKEWYWKPTMFRAFIEESAVKLALFDSRDGVVKLPRRRHISVSSLGIDD
jgi:hypothetical protein